MGRLIDADKLKQHYAWWENGTAEMTLAEAKRNFDTIIDVQPTVDAEPTEEQVKEYCRKRCLVIVASELFNEMKARWSAEPVVRCKDCKYADEYGMCGRVAWYNKKDDYCSHGERRKDAETKADRNGFVKQDDLFPQGR